MTESNYNFPGVLFFLQSEYRKYERERNEWNIERADLLVFHKCNKPDSIQSKITILNGKLKNAEQENVELEKSTKILQTALKQQTMSM